MWKVLRRSTFAGVTTLLGLFSSLASVIRWGEPWDIELDDDPLLDRSDTGWHS